VETHTDEEVREAKAAFRSYLVTAAREASKEFDRTLITLASGALAITFAFSEKFAAPSLLWLLLVSWYSWVASLLCSLWSFQVGRDAKVFAINQLDLSRLDPKRPGGWRDMFTKYLNNLAVVTFIVGVFLVSFYLKASLEGTVMAEQKRGIETTPQKTGILMPDMGKRGEVTLPAPPAAAGTPAATPSGQPQAQAPKSGGDSAGGK
jgi:hypothetical protein